MVVRRFALSLDRVPLRLADFLRSRRHAVLEAWEAELRGLPAAGSLPHSALRNHLPVLLDWIAERLSPPRETGEDSEPGTGPDMHALERLGDGFDLRQVAMEYRLLRRCVLRLWQAQGFTDTPEAMALFHEAVDEALELAVTRHLQARDESARAQAEQSQARLSASEAQRKRWEEIFTHLSVGVALVRAEDDVLEDVNPAFARMHGSTREELIGRPLADTFAPESRGMLPRHAAAAHSKHHHEYESMHLRKDGSRFPAYAHVTALKDESGKVVQRASTVLDITQRRTAELERQRLLMDIEAERSRLATVLDRLPAGVVLAEASSGRVVLSNRQAESIHGRPFIQADHYAGYSEYQGFHLDGRPYTREEWPLVRSMLTGEVVQGEEIVTYRPDGQRIVIMVSSAPIRDRAEQIAAGVVTFVDVTELRRAEAAARQAAEFGEKLIGIVSHDLRNPLNAIHLSVTQLLHSETLSAREQRAAARAAKSVDRMKRMISELLDFTRGRLGGGIPIHRVSGDLRAVVRQGVEELEAAWPERTVRLRVEPGRYEGEWDADRLVQVVSNLGSNALQYSPPETPVTFTLQDRGESVTLQVHNTGAPIPPEALPHLFDPFRRASSEGGGLGLGLYIVEQVVKGHGGRIEVTSTAESGTLFQMVLPRKGLAA
jgi:PAS domain S-box-containing protein